MDDEDLVQAYLRERDVLCPLCGYNLRNLTSPRCPECGERVELHIKLAEPKTAAWLAGVLGLSAGLGFSVLFLLLVMCLSPLDLSFLAQAWPLWIGGAVESVLLVMWIRKAMWLRRRSASGRRLAAILCWGLTGLIVALFGMSVA